MKLHPDVQRCNGKHCPSREGCARFEQRAGGTHAFDNMCGPELQHRVTAGDIARFHGGEIELLGVVA